MKVSGLVTLCAFFYLASASAFSLHPQEIKNRTDRDIPLISRFLRGEIAEIQTVVWSSPRLDSPILEDEPCAFRMTLRRLAPDAKTIKVQIDRGLEGEQVSPLTRELHKVWLADGNRCSDTHSRLFGPIRGAFTQILYFDRSAQAWIGREPQGFFSIETFLTKVVLSSDGAFAMDFTAKNLVSRRDGYSYVRFKLDSASTEELRDRLYIKPQAFASNPDAILNSEDPCRTLTECRAIFDKVTSIGFLPESRRPKLGDLLMRPDGSILNARDQVEAEEECRARGKSLPTAKQMIESTAIECSKFGQRLCGARIVDGQSEKQDALNAGLTYASVTNPGYISESFWFRAPQVGDKDYCLWTSSWIDTDNGRARWPQILGTSGEFFTPGACNHAGRAVRCLDR